MCFSRRIIIYDDYLCIIVVLLIKTILGSVWEVVCVSLGEGVGWVCINIYAVLM